MLEIQNAGHMVIGTIWIPNFIKANLEKPFLLYSTSRTETEQFSAGISSHGNLKTVWISIQPSMITSPDRQELCQFRSSRYLPIENSISPTILAVFADASTTEDSHVKTVSLEPSP
jgi:hypothetical protein